ncbi:MAG: MFS transporter [Marmoricola sp.]
METHSVAPDSAVPARVHLGHHRLAAAVAFATQGGIFISLTTRLPDIQDRWHISTGTLSLLMLMMVLLAGAGSVLAERLALQLTSATLLRVGLLLVAAGLLTITLAPRLQIFVGGLALYGVALGTVDACTNMQAVALEHRYRRPILPSFYAAWTLGGLIGSAVALALGAVSLQWTACLAVIPLAGAAAPFLPRARAASPAPQADIPWRPIVLVGLAMVLFYMVDTASTTWGPEYLKHVFTTPSQLVAIATFPYLLASLIMRGAGDRIVERFGATPVVRVAALATCVSLAVVVFAPTWPVAVLGFALTGASASVIAPLSFSAAARIAGGDDLTADERMTRTDAVIARFNLFNYVGALLGSVLTGAVGTSSLRIGFAVPLVLVLGLIPLAAAFGWRPTGAADQTGMSAQ